MSLFTRMGNALLRGGSTAFITFEDGQPDSAQKAGSAATVVVVSFWSVSL